MPRVYGVQDADDKLSGWMSEDETDAAPTGETAVLESLIRAADPPGADGRIQSGGHWDGTTYTPPVGERVLSALRCHDRRRNGQGRRARHDGRV